MLDPRFSVFRQPLRHFLVAAHQRSACPTAEQANTCPQVRGDLQFTGIGAGHKILPLPMQFTL